MVTFGAFISIASIIELQRQQLTIKFKNEYLQHNLKNIFC